MCVCARCWPDSVLSRADRQRVPRGEQQTEFTVAAAKLPSLSCSTVFLSNDCKGERK